MKKLTYRFYFICTALLLLTAAVFTACDKFVDFKDVILVTGTENDPLVKFTVEGVPSSFNVTATATRKVDQDITVNFGVDTGLVKAYNTKMSANFYVLPADSYELSATSGVIKANANISEPVTVRIKSTTSFIDGRTYLLPVTIKNVSGSLEVLEASRTIFLRISRVIDFKSMDISTPSFYYTHKFAQPVSNISRFTYEIKCYINDWHPGSNQISRLSNWGPEDESVPNLLRFGEAGSKINQLQWVSGEGSVFSATEFATKTWYTISCVYDGTSYKMYVNGKLDASFEGGGKAYQLGILEIGMSYAGYESAQRFLGRISEVRFWDRSLGMAEIQAGLCGVDAASPGLLGYWKMNEGSGQVVTDRTGKGRNLTWPANKPIVWNSDAINKCAQ